jgi:spermidine/putrescine transport system substrate-binding protein
MVFHPRQRYPWGRVMSRRDMLRLTGGTALSAAVLAACGEGGGTSSPGGSSPSVLIGTPENPVQQPIYDDNPPIESNLEPEPGPLRVYNWDAYIYTRVLKDFAEEHGVDFELTTFYNLEEATRKLRTGRLKFDVFFPTAEIIPKFVAGKLLQPLNRDYLPHLQENIWPRLSSPYYDRGSRYTVPYVVYQTGIGWRADVVTDDIPAMDNPWEIFWDATYKDKVGVYDDYRETIAVGMFKSGITNVNSAKPSDLRAAKENLIELIDLVNIRFTIDGAYAKLPEGKLGLHHAWSGDMVGAPYYAPKGEDPSVLRYHWPPANDPSLGGYISNDAIAIPSNAEHPVLAHMFLDYMLSKKGSLKNFGWLGYQPPQKSLDPDTLVKDGWVPDYLATAVIRQEDFQRGQAPVQLSPQEDAAWLQAWSEIQSGG